MDGDVLPDTYRAAGQIRQTAHDHTCYKWQQYLYYIGTRDCHTEGYLYKSLML